MYRKLFFAFGMAALVTAVAPTASADIFNLNQIFCNCLPAGSSAGGTVTLTGSTDRVDFEVVLNPLLDFHFTNPFNAFAFSYVPGVAITVTSDTTNFAADTTAKVASMDGAGMSFTNFLDWTGGARYLRH